MELNFWGIPIAMGSALVVAVIFILDRNRRERRGKE